MTQVRVVRLISLVRSKRINNLVLTSGKTGFIWPIYFFRDGFGRVDHPIMTMGTGAGNSLPS